MTLAQKLYEASWEPSPLITVPPLPPWDNAPKSVREHYEHLATVAESALAGSDAATSAARVEELLDVLARLVATRKGIEFASTEEQRAWRVARAVLVEAGR
jgi:hypothetical protein